MSDFRKNITVVLVHGAWFDGSSWSRVTAELERKGYRVVAAQLPLTSLREDTETVRRLIRRIGGPVALVGHSYGGAVITAAGAGDSSVRALGYVAAIVPDEGETVGQLFGRVPPHRVAPSLKPDPDGFLWLEPSAFDKAVAPESLSVDTALLATAQKPISVRCLGEQMGEPAWKEKPTWFLVAENDKMLSPDTRRFEARRMNSTTSVLRVDHTPLVSAPLTVVKFIEDLIASITDS